ncbi:transcriptional regulator [Euryarchaeota archaeon ex4484_178]|nr:MAG: transcriptional regulator [Euryarchaeota archaeon ex4484_178]
MQTRRGRIAELIENRDMSPSEIAKFLDLPLKTVLEDLKHIAKSPKYGEMLILPARCRKCGYVFRAEIKLPKKCPKCKSTWIDEPRFMLRK